MNAHSSIPDRDPAASRRAQILDAATEVIAAKGFHRATIRDIARAAGIAEGTIYLYFETKTDLLFGLLDRFNETAERPQAFAALAAPADGDLRTAFAGQLRHRLERVGDQLPLLRAVLPELLFHDELRQRWVEEVLSPTTAVAEAAFAELAAAGALRPTDAPLTVRLVAGMVFGTVLLGLLGDPVLAARRDELPERIVALLFDGLRPDRGAP